MDTSDALFVAHESRARNLTDKQRAFVAAYTDASSPSFLNATESARRVSPSAKPELMDKYGYKWRHNPKVANAITEVLERAGFGVNRRLERLSEIGNGTARFEKEVVTKRGVTHVKVSPTFQERLHAIDLANRMDGTYHKAAPTDERSSEEATELRHRILHRMLN